MNNKKIVYISVGVAVFLFSMMCLSLVFMTGGIGGGNKMNKSMESAVKGYLEKVNKGQFSESYKSVASTTQGDLSEEKYIELMTILMDEEDARIEINDKKNVTARKEGLSKKDSIKVTDIPLTRVYKCNIDGVKQQVQEDMVLSIIEESGASKIYYNFETLNSYIEEYVLSKANRAAVDALQNKSDEKIVAKNLEILDRCVKYADTVSSEYKRYDIVLLETNLMLAYKYFIMGENDNALNYIESAYSSAQTVEDRVRVKRVEAELYKVIGDYDSAVKVLAEALELSPTNVDIRREYRDVNGRMLDNIESSLSSGWVQLRSAIGQGKKERKRILEDVALDYSESAIKLKTDAPDGYYLKGNILYCLGDYSGAINELEKALEYTKDEDTLFRNKVSEIIGMAKVAANTSEEVSFDAKSYSSVYDGDIRSYIFRDNEVGGLIDATK